MPEGLSEVAGSQIGEHENVYEELLWLPQVRVMKEGLEFFCSALHETGCQNTDRY